VAGPDLDEFHDLLAEELNVEAIHVENDLDRFQRIELAPNFRALAPKARAAVNDVAQAIRNAADPEALLQSIHDGGAEVLGVMVEPGDVEVKRVERVGFAAQTVQVSGTDDAALHVSLVLDMNDSPALLSKGMARDITRRVQAQRKSLDLDLEATIDLEIWMVNGPNMEEADEAWVASETRCAACVFHGDGSTPPDGAECFEVDGTTIHFTVS
jgi:isoleucyl-tRNA synthetase